MLKVTKEDIEGARLGYAGLFTSAEVQDLEWHFIHVLGLAGSRLKFRRKVVSTAIVFFKRLCLKHRLVDINPWLLCATVLYLASKVEESFTKIQEILSAVQPKPSTAAASELVDVLTEKNVLECEFYVLESLNYQLVVFHPYRPLQQFLLDIDLGEAILQTAWSVVNDSYRLDLCLLVPPYMIALAAIRIGCAFVELDVTEWFERLNVNQVEVDEITMRLLEMYRSAQQKSPEALLDRLTPLLRRLSPAAPAAPVSTPVPPPRTSK